MNDSSVLKALISAFGTRNNLAAALRISRQSLWNWEDQGFPLRARIRLKRLASEKAIKLPPDFLERARQ